MHAPHTSAPAVPPTPAPVAALPPAASSCCSHCTLRVHTLCLQVLLVVGLEDQVVPADNSRAMASRLERPWLVLLEGGHAAFVQHQPTFLQVLDAFLSA